MKERKVFTVTDLGPGDGGKGGIVHKICSLKHAHTVLKVGGAQGSHGVRTTKGQEFNFSHFGCGTFEGAKTHITSLMIIEPLGLIREGELLKFEWGMMDIFEQITIDQDALCITPFHGAASQLRELARKNHPKGTVGIGGGEAVRDARIFPDLAIYAKDLGKANLLEKLDAIRMQKLIELTPIIENMSNFWESDQEVALNQIKILLNEAYTDTIARRFKKLNSLVTVVDQEYLQKKILSRDGVMVVESSHGILTDRYHGFHPHTTQLRTLPQKTFDMLANRGYTGDIIKLGVTRAYQIRHGAGPMVTESSELRECLLPGSSKGENRWQGKVRVGPLDIVALKYAIEVCGGPQALTGLAISWFDQIRINRRWDICESYIGADDPTFFSSKGDITVRHGNNEEQLAHQEALGKKLNSCKPRITSYEVPEGNNWEVAQFCANLLEEKLKVPVRMVSLGPTESDKVCL